MLLNIPPGRYSDDELRNILKDTLTKKEDVRKKLYPIQDINIVDIEIRLRKADIELDKAIEADLPLKEQYVFVNKVIYIEKELEDAKEKLKDWKEYYRLTSLQDDIEVMLEPMDYTMPSKRQKKTEENINKKPSKRQKKTEENINKN